MNKYQYVECILDKDGALRVSKILTEKEYEALRPLLGIVYKVNKKDWAAAWAGKDNNIKME